MADADASRSSLKLVGVGCGGQGVVSIARILGDAAMMADWDVRVGQLHGMSQRGGSVEVSVLLGPGDSSFIADGAADVVLGLEPLEASRARRKMSARTIAVVSSGRVVPHTLVQQGLAYPDVDELLADIRAVAGTLIEVDGASLTRQSGTRRALNIVMLGALAGLGVLPFEHQMLERAIEQRSPPRYLEHNRRAFELGMGAVVPWTSR